jgi:hypothetical protein
MPTARLSVDCSIDERKTIKALSAMNDESMSRWVMEAVRERMRKEAKNLPNNKTIKALLDSQKGKGVRKHGSVEEVFKGL